MNKTKEEQALANLEKLEEANLISRREFLTLSSQLTTASVLVNLMTPTDALAWVATRMRKGKASAGSNIDVGDIANSVRLRTAVTAYFSRTPASSTATGRQKWTWSGWIKRGRVGIAQTILAADINSTTLHRVYFSSSDTLTMYFEGSAGAIKTGWITNSVFRDPGAFLHLVIVQDTTEVAVADRCRFYINGVLQTVTTSSYAQSYISQNSTLYINDSTSQNIGRSQYYGDLFDGYLSRIAFVDGQVLTPSSFAYLNSNSNSWVTKSQTAVKTVVDAGGANSFMLEFDDATSFATLSSDKSSKGNNWTCNNISLTAGVTYDWFKDIPGNNYCTWNPLSKNSDVTSYAGNLHEDGSAGTAGLKYILGTIAIPSSGKWYWEIYRAASAEPTYYMIVGIADVTSAVWNNDVTTGSVLYFSSNGNVYTNGVAAAYGSAYNVGATIGIAVDTTNNQITFYLNGVSQGTLAIAAGVTWVPYLGRYGAGTKTNFGQLPFTYSPPAGSKSLSTANLPTPAISNSKKHFDLLTYAGDGTNNRNLSLNQFDADLMWFKQRTGVAHNMLVDRVRGNDKALISNLTNAEASYTGYFSFGALGSKQVTISYSGSGGADFGYNQSSSNYVAWLWKAAGATVANNTGSIASQVSANQTAGFSIVSYTGTGVAAMVGHGLGAIPKFVIVKNRDSAGYGWPISHPGLAASTYYVVLNSTNAQANDSTVFAGAHTSSVITLGSNAGTNGSTNKMIAYCFAEIAGYSKFGKYTGNGSTDGPFVWCGFRPRYVMIKRIDTVSDWILLDNSRDSYNQMGAALFPNSNGAELTTANNNIDIVSNGFKVRTSVQPAENASGGTYIFAAFAEAPFKYANAR